MSHVFTVFTQDLRSSLSVRGDRVLMACSHYLKSGVSYNGLNFWAHQDSPACSLWECEDLLLREGVKKRLVIFFSSPYMKAPWRTRSMTKPEKLIFCTATWL